MYHRQSDMMILRKNAGLKSLITSSVRNAPQPFLFHKKSWSTPEQEGQSPYDSHVPIFSKSRFKVKVTLWHNIIKSCTKFIFWPNLITVLHLVSGIFNIKTNKKGKARMTHMCQLFLKSRFKVKVTLWHNIVKSCIKFIFWPNFITVLHLVSEIFNIKTKNRQSTFQAYPDPWPLVKVTMCHIILKDVQYITF